MIAVPQWLFRLPDAVHRFFFFSRLWILIPLLKTVAMFRLQAKLMISFQIPLCLTVRFVIYHWPHWTTLVVIATLHRYTKGNFLSTIWKGWKVVYIMHAPTHTLTHKHAHWQTHSLIPTHSHNCSGNAPLSSAPYCLAGLFVSVGWIINIFRASLCIHVSCKCIFGIVYSSLWPGLTIYSHNTSDMKTLTVWLCQFMWHCERAEG